MRKDNVRVANLANIFRLNKTTAYHAKKSAFQQQLSTLRFSAKRGLSAIFVTSRFALPVCMFAKVVTSYYQASFYIKYVIRAAE